jgi:hypothetical protein
MSRMSTTGRIKRWAGEHKALSAALAVGLGGGLAFLTFWFAPWKLFVDEAVHEAQAVELRVLSTGSFRSLEHETLGRALILEGPGGERTLRLEELRTSNGPDLVVILSPTPSSEDSWTAYGKGEVVELGPLKGNLGSQNYAIPAGVDLARLKSAVVWCRRFSVAFGSAPLSL